MVRSRGLRPANGASCAVGPMMLIFFLGAAQAVPLYKMNNESVNDNNSILDSDLHNLAFADSDTAVVADGFDLAHTLLARWHTFLPGESAKLYWSSALKS